MDRSAEDISRSRSSSLHLLCFDGIADHFCIGLTEILATCETGVDKHFIQLVNTLLFRQANGFFLLNIFSESLLLKTQAKSS